MNRVAPDAWSNTSPCEGWTARDVVHHVVELSAGLAAGDAPGLLGPKVEVAPDADEQARFIAFMGRRP